MSIIEGIFEYSFLFRIFDKLLKDKEKLNLICNKFIYYNKSKLRFNERHYFCEINKNKWYSNCLTNIIVKKLFKFPVNVTSVTFHDSFNESIENLRFLNKNITHLNFGRKFNQRVDNYIPNSVVHLQFGNYFCKSVCEIPNSVKHLKFENYPVYFNIERLPSFITHLSIKHCNAKIYKLPSSLEKLECSNRFYNLNKNRISSTTKVKVITFFFKIRLNLIKMSNCDFCDQKSFLTMLDVYHEHNYNYCAVCYIETYPNTKIMINKDNKIHISNENPILVLGPFIPYEQPHIYILIREKLSEELINMIDNKINNDNFFDLCKKECLIQKDLYECFDKIIVNKVVSKYKNFDKILFVENEIKYLTYEQLVQKLKI